MAQRFQRVADVRSERRSLCSDPTCAATCSPSVCRQRGDVSTVRATVRATGSRAPAYAAPAHHHRKRQQTPVSAVPSVRGGMVPHFERRRRAA